MEHPTNTPLSRIARLKVFARVLGIREIIFFNIVFAYVWGYLLWGTALLWSGKWWFDAFGHVLWPCFHAWKFISLYQHHSAEFGFRRWRWMHEVIVWFAMLLLALFWELGELIHDTISQFTTRAQVNSADTLMDILFTGIVAPLVIIWWRRWKDGLRLFFGNPDKKAENEHDAFLVGKILSRMAERQASEDPRVIRKLWNLVRKEWGENHRIQPIVKGLYEVARGSRQERRRQCTYLRNTKSVKV